MTPESRNNPLLDNGSINISEVTPSTVERLPLLGTFPSQRIGTQDRRTVRGGHLCSVRPEVVKGGHIIDSSVPRVEAGSNTSTVTMRVVGGDERGSLKFETVKYGLKFQGTRTRKWLRWRGPVAMANDIPVLSSERTPHSNKPATVWQ
jgi:hypothetical protein